MSPAQPPTAIELLADPVVQSAMKRAWIDSLADDPVARHEEGGWIYLNLTTGQVSVKRARAGGNDSVDLANPPLQPGAIVVGTFHTHPNPTVEGWEPGASPDDDHWANVSGV